MHKNFLVLTGLLGACSTPAYRAPEVPIPAVYNVSSTVTSVGSGGRGTSEDVPARGI
ncbi:MAG: hypothetical protein PVSMB1_14060 [Gemmatimonadaceae bacterium]